ncbi:hypothetical protein LINPERPRIM_LOCUS22064 [Linum perenne]
MYTAEIAAMFWVGSMRELTRLPGSIKKASSFLRSARLSKRTGSHQSTN